MQDPFFYSQNNSLKRDLFIRNQQMEGLSRELEKVMLLPKTKRKKWVADNELFLSQIFDIFSEDSVLALDGVKLDDQGMDLSVEFVSHLRNIMTILRSIMGKTKQLKS